MRSEGKHGSEASREPHTPPGRRHEPWRWAGAVLCAAALLAGLGGCLTAEPLTPYPNAVVVSHPDKVNPALGYEELREAYSTSPDRNPDGLGVFEPIEARSRMLLLPAALELLREERNRIAYARTPEEQAAVLRSVRDFMAGNVAFTGVLRSYRPQVVNARWYLPEGIYLIDDRGRKFTPTRIEEAPTRYEFFLKYPDPGPYSTTADVPVISTGFPLIVFPRAAIAPETRAVTLYFAAVQRRYSFTWIFDPAYVPKRDDLGPQHGGGMNRLFGKP
jgi:hypothetical protein